MCETGFLTPFVASDDTAHMNNSLLFENARRKMLLSGF